MTIKEFFSFRANRFFWLNILAMPVVLIIGVFATLRWLDAYTRHGEGVIVPDVKHKSLPEALRTLDRGPAGTGYRLHLRQDPAAGLCAGL